MLWNAPAGGLLVALTIPALSMQFKDPGLDGYSRSQPVIARQEICPQRLALEEAPQGAGLPSIRDHHGNAGGARFLRRLQLRGHASHGDSPDLVEAEPTDLFRHRLHRLDPARRRHLTDQRIFACSHSSSGHRPRTGKDHLEDFGQTGRSVVLCVELSDFLRGGFRLLGRCGQFGFQARQSNAGNGNTGTLTNDSACTPVYMICVVITRRTV